MNLDELPELDLHSGDLYAGLVSADAALSTARLDPGLARSQRGIEVLSYDLVLDLMRDQRFGMAMRPRLARLGITDGIVLDIRSSVLNNREGMEHARMRRACASWFTARGVERLRDSVRSWVSAWLDEYWDVGSFDFHRVIGHQLPARVFCALVGAPLEEAEVYGQLSADATRAAQPPQPGSREAVVNSAIAGEKRIRELIRERRKNPGQDLVSHMTAAEARGEISEDDIFSVVFNVLTGSTDTTDTQMCLNMVSLAENPGQWKLLADTPDALPNAVLELMRYNPGVWSIMRSAIEPADFHGISVTPDVTLWPSIFAANRDPRVYQDADRLDVTRELTRMPVNFGSGIHACLGRMVSLLEQQEVLRAAQERWSEFEVTSLDVSGAMYNKSVSALVVRFDAK